MNNDFDRAHRSLSPRAPKTTTRRTAAAIVSCALAGLLACPQVASAGQLDAPPPTLPADDAPASAEPTPEAGPAAPASTAAPVVVVEGPAVPAPRVDNGRLSLKGNVLWDGLQGQMVTLALVNGAELRGEVVAHAGDSVAISRADDGMVVGVPKSEVAGVRVRSRGGGAGAAATMPVGQRPIDDGRKLYAGGVTMLSIGVPFGTAGIVMLGLCPRCLYIHLPLLLPGIGLIVGGAVALKRSKQRLKTFRKAWGIPLSRRMRLTPSLAVARGGGEVGFTLRF